MKLLGLILVALAVASPGTAADKGKQLRRTMADIALLNSQLVQRKADASVVRDELAARYEALRAEALQIIDEKRVDAPDKALGHPRLFFNLMLMAEIKAYADRYTEKIAYYRVACDRLGYLYQQADDDLKIVNTLSDLKIDALVSQADKILDDYLVDAQTLVIHPETLAPDPPERIYAAIHPRK